MLVDNDCNPWQKALECPWGLSILIKTPSTEILFDTGPSPEALKHNAEILGVNLSRINIVVISHEHFDHIGGLSAVTSANPKVRVYVPRGMSSYALHYIESLTKNVVEVGSTTIISKGIAIVGPLYGPPYEEALLVNVCGFGGLLVVGCSHPGVTNFVKLVKKDLGINVTIVIGGFHLIGSPRPYVEEVVKNLLSLGVKFITPIHCSGNEIRAVLEKRYPSNYISANVGTTLYVDP